MKDIEMLNLELHMFGCKNNILFHKHLPDFVA